MSAANLLWIRCRPAVVGQYLPPESVDLVIGSPPPPESVDELSFEYLATAWLMGREAAETLRLEPLFGGGSARSEGAEVTAFRHALASATGALKPGGWCTILLEGDDPDRVLAVALAAAAAELELVARHSPRVGEGGGWGDAPFPARLGRRSPARRRPPQTAPSGRRGRASHLSRARRRDRAGRGEPPTRARRARRPGADRLRGIDRAASVPGCCAASSRRDRTARQADATVEAVDEQSRARRPRRAGPARRPAPGGAVARRPSDPGSSGGRRAASVMVAARADPGRGHDRRSGGMGHVLVAHDGRSPRRIGLPGSHLRPLPGHVLARRRARSCLPRRLRDGGGTGPDPLRGGSRGPHGGPHQDHWPGSWTSGIGSGSGPGSAAGSRIARGATVPSPTCSRRTSGAPTSRS